MTVATEIRSKRIRPDKSLVASICAIGLATCLLLAFTPASLISGDTVTFLVIAACASVTVCAVLASSSLRSTRVQQALLPTILALDGILIVSEGLFQHLGSTSSAEASSFGSGVYQQVGLWLLCAALLVVVALKTPTYFSGLLSGDRKWMTFFALLAIVSAPLSVSPTYSLAWTFKLSLVVLLASALSNSISDSQDIFKVFRVLLVAAFLVTLCRFVTPFFMPGPAFKGGRLELIAGLSGYGGLLVILVSIDWITRKSLPALLIGTFAIAMMFLTGGKAGILASVVGVVIFFLSIKKAGTALMAVTGLCLVLSLFAAFTPLGSYLQHYQQSGQASTLTGRLDLWKVIWPEIMAHPILGHGYLASRFLSSEVTGVFAEAGQTHNSLLEPLYNNGIGGLLLVVMMNYALLSNIFAAFRHQKSRDLRLLCAGTFALYLNLFVWGMFTAIPFGGAPNSAFIIFLTLLMISGHLRKQALAESERAV
jgi:O-Antigen ligase